ncbi:hypothetical protein FKO01_04945 [Mesorhizobium sp. B2-3-3]|nr:hypothetical protein FKO01_04945 [Mesorhizobium sp. B2-3-3]
MLYKITASAAGEAMPAANLNRRRMLLGLAAASTAAATVTVATAGTPTISENPELLRIAEELPAAEAGYVAARKHQEDLLKKGMSVWPVAPDEIAIARPFQPSHMERAFHGGAITRKGEMHPRELITASDLEWRIEQAQRFLKGDKLEKRKIQGMNRQEWQAKLAEAQRLHPIALRYEAKINRIKKTANYEASWRSTKAAAKALAAIITATMEQPDRTMEGIFIKAEALAAWGRLDAWDQHFGIFDGSMTWCAKLGADLLRYSKTTAA